MNLQALEAELRKIEQKRKALERRYETRKTKQFTGLPKKVGLRSVDDLILSLTPYASPRLKARIGIREGAPGYAAGVSGIVQRRRGPGRPPGTAAAKTARRRRGRPPRYSQETKAAIRRALEKGGTTATALVKQYGVSRSSIKDWKREWGLTRYRKKK